MSETKETSETIPRFRELSVAELDGKLEEAAADNERSEKLICFYLFEMRNRRGHESFGFASIYDYAAERFGPDRRHVATIGWRRDRGAPGLPASLSANTPHDVDRWHVAVDPADAHHAETGPPPRGAVEREDLQLLSYLGETREEIDLLEEKVPRLLGLA